MDSSSLHALIDQLPAELQREDYDFAAFLLEKRGEQPHAKKLRVKGLHRGETIIVIQRP